MTSVMEESLGLEDLGIWLPAVIDLAQVECVKLATDNEDQPGYNMASMYMKSEGSYITDIPFSVLKQVFIKFKGNDVFNYKTVEASL
jgi:hypothetical protein